MGYLTPDVRRRDNLKILANTEVDRVVFEDWPGDWCRGDAATGQSERQSRTSNRPQRLFSRQGALQTPALLIRSGVGPAGDLKALGLPVVADLPRGRPELAGSSGGIDGGLSEAGRQTTDDRCAPLPTWHCGIPPGSRAAPTPTCMCRSPINPPGIRWASNWVGWSACIYKPMSRGRVSVATPERGASPRIEFNLLSDARDVERMKAALRLDIRDLPTSRRCRALFTNSSPRAIRNASATSTATVLQAGPGRGLPISCSTDRRRCGAS